nr:thiamine-phosphate kinase [Paenibacillus turpanensis]
MIRLMTGQKGTKVSRPDIVVGIGDDAAVVEPGKDKQLVLSCDTMTDVVHFNETTMADADIGWKALASNVSDMAAMGAEPRWALVAISAPKGAGTAERLVELYRGLYACAEAYGVEVIGGDTTSSAGGLTVTVTIVGEVERGRALLRSSAKPGDAVFVTGPLGGSAAGLHALMSGAAASAAERGERGAALGPLLRAHRRPRPRVDAGRLLAASGFGVALNDVSDGLASEAWELAEASGVRLVLEAGAVPVLPEAAVYAAEAGADALAWALYGGEDYELVGTVRAGEVDALAARFAAAGLELFFVGRVEPGEGVVLRGADGTEQRLDKRGYNHFGT